MFWEVMGGDRASPRQIISSNKGEWEKEGRGKFYNHHAGKEDQRSSRLSQKERMGGNLAQY